jgi:hypothetical protein
MDCILALLEPQRWSAVGFKFAEFSQMGVEHDFACEKSNRLARGKNLEQRPLNTFLLRYP